MLRTLWNAMKGLFMVIISIPIILIIMLSSIGDMNSPRNIPSYSYPKKRPK